MAKLKLNERDEQKEKLVDSIVDSIGGALKTDVGEIAEILNITEVDEASGDSGSELAEITGLALRNGEPDANAPKVADELPVRKIRYAFVCTAVAMIFFAVVGVVNSIGFVSRTADDISTRRALREEMALFIYPVVINDPAPFDFVGQLPDSTIIISAIWHIMLMEETTLYQTEDHVGVLYIPEAAVERAAHLLFGTGGLNHQSVASGRTEFIYSDEYRRYQVPENLPPPPHSPMVTLVTNVGETYMVTVDYMPPNPFAIAGIERENEPIKTMIFVITRTRDRMTIDSVRFGEFVA